MTLELFLVKVGVVWGSGAGGQPLLVPAGMVHGKMNHAQQGQQPGPMMYLMAQDNGMFQVRRDGRGAAGTTSSRWGGYREPRSSDGRSAMTQADMMNHMGDRAIMENSRARKCGAPEDRSCERSIEHRHYRMIKNLLKIMEWFKENVNAKKGGDLLPHCDIYF
uniref:Uncharacterized protein n=1 Tax=Aegilops tauschii TaxID=37682 RepID=M8B730_AEGTA